MPTIFDNIETEFLENAAHNGLRDALKVARRGIFVSDISAFLAKKQEQLDRSKLPH